MNNQQSRLSYLMEESYQIKALVKYEIKCLESRLKKAMDDSKHSGIKSQGAAYLCSELVLKYDDLLQYTPHDFQQNALKLDESKTSNLNRSYATIQMLKGQFNARISLSEEVKLLYKLKYHYRCLQEQLSQVQCLSFELTQEAVPKELEAVLASNSCSTWLTSMITFANDTGERSLSCSNIIPKLNESMLLRLASFFENPDITLLINSIFFYKIHPEKLFKKGMHYEKLISVKARLASLYQFIENVHQIVRHHLSGIGNIQDYLFHEEELPPGIMIKVEDNAHLILRALKEWRIHGVYSDDFVVKNKLNDLFRAYKFWFNPDRLIDTVMTLQQLLMRNSCDLPIDYKKFSLAMQTSLFHQLSTTDCLFLYGYFANKDSRYLMRTLAAVLEDKPMDAFPHINLQQKKAISLVYKTLDCVMEAIREVLQTRHIVTEAYPSRLNDQKPLKPGRRNIQAITHILNLYCAPPSLENKTLDELFKQAESNS